MQADKDSIITIFLVLPIFTQFILRSAVCHIHDLGKSKTFRKKGHRSLSLFQKVLLIGYAEDCKYYTSQAKKLRIAYWVGIFYPIVAVVCWILSSAFPLAVYVLQGLLYVKVVLFDIPVFVFFFLMTKHGKNGGVTWKWEVPH